MEEWLLFILKVNYYFYCNFIGGLEAARKFSKNLKCFILAESLGGVESLSEIPSLMTHFSVPVEERKKLGIEDNLIRLSCGIEDIEYLL